MNQKAKRLNKKKQKPILRIILILLIFGGAITFVITKFWTGIDNDDIQNVINENLLEQTNIAHIETVSPEEVPKEYNNYSVIAMLEIPKISVNTKVLSEYSDAALNVSVTKFWTGEPNELGNFCISGHNYQNYDFHNLKNMELGDKIYVTDLKGRRITYEVYRVYTVEPEDTSSVSQSTNGRRDVTLITCTKGAERRVIVKATAI